MNSELILYYLQYYGFYVILPMVIGVLSQWYIKHTYEKFSQVGNSNRITGAFVAQAILQLNGITDVRIEEISGTLTDHYDPKDKVMRLSSAVYRGTSISAIGVAAHETGHAIQHNVGYIPVKIRSFMVPVTQVGSKVSIPIVLLGCMFANDILVTAGIIVFLTVVFFQLITLPVEFNASGRALKVLKSEQYLNDVELKGARKVLTAAALTYVASVLSSIIQLIRLMSYRRND